MRGRTTIVITHRRDLARSADRVVVLDGAGVVQSGGPHDLIDQPGLFARRSPVR